MHVYSAFTDNKLNVSFAEEIERRLQLIIPFKGCAALRNVFF
jgi:hypothetical protein